MLHTQSQYKRLKLNTALVSGQASENKYIFYLNVANFQRLTRDIHNDNDTK